MHRVTRRTSRLLCHSYNRYLRYTVNTLNDQNNESSIFRTGGERGEANTWLVIRSTGVEL